MYIRIISTMYDKNKTMTDCMHQLQEANTLSIGWRRLMEGMISRELVELQKCALVEAESWLTVDNLAKELVAIRRVNLSRM